MQKNTSEIVFDTSILIAVDFDGTITKEDNFPNTNYEIDPVAIKWLRRLQKEGAKIICWSCRGISEKIIQELAGYDFAFDYIDKDNGLRSHQRKLNADFYIDDRSSLTGKIQWEETFYYIKNKIMSNYLKMQNKRFISWEEIDKFCNSMVEKVKGYSGIYAIPKGGLILGAILAYRANIPMLAAPCKGCLVVDEISATGITLKPYSGRYDILTMFYCDETDVIPTLTQEKVINDWIIFPWE